MFESMKEYIPNINKEGYIIITGLALGTFILSMLSSPLGWIGFISTLLAIFFFRDPERVRPIEHGIILSPADGIVQSIVKSVPPIELNMGETERTRVSIFLSVFDVHVNRVAIDGEVVKLHYVPGKFFNASLDKASEYNERQSILLKTQDNKEVVIVQIAGFIARRIVCSLTEGAKVKAGERFGIIKFGSRVDVYLPVDVEPRVLVGQRMVGGESIIAYLSEQKLHNATQS